VRRSFGRNNNLFYKKEEIVFNIFDDEGKVIKYFIIIFSIIGILAAIQHWIILIKEFGSIPMVLIKSATVYRMRVDGEIKGVIPYVFTFTFIAIFLSALYAGYKNKFSLLMILPFFALIIKSLAEVARASMLFGILLFFITYFLMRHIKSKQLNSGIKINNKKIVLSLLSIMILVILTASLVKNFKSPAENYKASTKELRQLEDGFLISPSIYLYASAHIGVFNAYMREQGEKTSFGQNMFLPIYRILSKFDLVQEPSYYQKAYFVPVWTNTGTYLREIHADFGFIGLFCFPYFLGLLSTFYWFRFFENYKLSDLIVLTFLFLFIAFTFLVLVTRLSYWIIALIGLLVILPIIQKLVSFSVRNKKNSELVLDEHV
jgi:oligosaccharide repeat unit polymerase